MWNCQSCQHQNEANDTHCWSCGVSKGLADERKTTSELEACQNCGCQKVIPDVEIIDRDGDSQDANLSVRIDRNPNAILMKGSEVVKLKASICGACGYVQMFAEDPMALWNAYQIFANRNSGTT